jgi:LmbE family N-acetylglucosaminyl deacetylase
VVPENAPAGTRTFYDAIYLSPHLDDAVLSCGGQIYQRRAAGQAVLIVTITAGDPPPAGQSDYVNVLHQRWRLSGAVVAARRAEDMAACQLLGADCWHWPWPDCIYRRSPVTGEPLYVSDADIFGALHPADAPQIDSLAQQIASLPDNDRLFVPLTVGRHVDHQLVRRAAEQACQNSQKLRYYEDYPYAQRPEALAAALKPEDEWRPTVIPLSAEALEARIQAITCYQSQLSTFFADQADVRRQITSYAKVVGGERLWRKSIVLGSRLLD